MVAVVGMQGVLGGVSRGLSTCGPALYDRRERNTPACCIRCFCDRPG